MGKKKKAATEPKRTFNVSEYAYYLIQGRVEDFLPTVPDELFDCALMDLAYDSQEEHRQIGTTTRLQNWFETLPIEAFPPIFEAVYRTLKKGHHAYVFCDRDTSKQFEDIAVAAGFSFIGEIVWDKRILSTGSGWRKRTERILHLGKGKRPRQVHFKNLDFSDLQSIPSIRSGVYPSEKPVALMEKLILNSVDPGAVIFAPFAGSAPGGEAALRNFMQYVGVDISDEAIRVADERLGSFLERGSKFYEQFGFKD